MSHSLKLSKNCIIIMQFFYNIMSIWYIKTLSHRLANFKFILYETWHLLLKLCLFQNGGQFLPRKIITLQSPANGCLGLLLYWKQTNSKHFVCFSYLKKYPDSPAFFFFRRQYLSSIYRQFYSLVNHHTPYHLFSRAIHFSLLDKIITRHKCCCFSFYILNYL